MMFSLFVELEIVRHYRETSRASVLMLTFRMLSE